MIWTASNFSYSALYLINSLGDFYKNIKFNRNVQKMNMYFIIYTLKALVNPCSFEIATLN